MRAIVNASPLIYMGKLGRLDLLRNLYSEIITTPEVKNEVMIENYPEFAALSIAFDSWITVKTIENTELMQNLQSLQINLGEANVITLSIERVNDYVLILDDLIARTIAKTFNIRITGTLGVILDAMHSHIITVDQTRMLIDKLVTETPYRISVKLYQSILKKITEIEANN